MSDLLANKNTAKRNTKKSVVSKEGDFFTVESEVMSTTYRVPSNQKTTCVIAVIRKISYDTRVTHKPQKVCYHRTQWKSFLESGGFGHSIEEVVYAPEGVARDFPESEHTSK